MSSARCERPREREAADGTLARGPGAIRAGGGVRQFGRVVVRFSGTEPLVRVMVEGPKLDRVEHFAESIAAAIRSELG